MPTSARAARWQKGHCWPSLHAAHCGVSCTPFRPVSQHISHKSRTRGWILNRRESGLDSSSRLVDD